LSDRSKTPEGGVYVEVNGGRLLYEEEGSGPLVLLLHPGLWDRRVWDDQFGVFAERQRTIRYDLRGYGKSSRPEAEYSNVEDLHSLLTQLGVERASLVGCSMGGGVAVDFTLEHPEMVEALVLVASALSGVEDSPEDEAKWGPIWEPIEKAVKEGRVAEAIDMELEVWAPLGTDDESGRRIREIAQDNSDAFADMRELARTPEPGAAPRLGEIRVPTLIVLGAQDVPDINQRWETMGPRIPGSRTVVIDEADHVVAMRQPKQFNDLVLAFLAETV
jgi:pimeloyl-ACP methyl ester carboxylesterase